MSEYEYEEIRGLPGRLPPGESIVWQGAPSWRVLARRVFHIRTVAVYFAALIVVRGVAAVVLDEASLATAVGSAFLLLPVGLAALGLLAGLAWLHARTTVYTVTDRRIVLRFGIAVQLAVNLPFREIGGAALMQLPDGFGEIPVQTTGDGRLAYLHMWPHVRPGAFKHPEPMLRCVPNATEVAERLTQAWAADAERRGVETMQNRRPNVDERPMASGAGAPVGVLG